MWTGILPAVTSKFKENGELDHDEMTRFFGLQIEAGCDGLIVCGSLDAAHAAVRRTSRPDRASYMRLAALTRILTNRLAVRKTPSEYRI